MFGLPPGDYYVSATLRTGGPEVTDPMGGEPSGYAATYFPGTTNVAEATRITIGVAQENTGISFGLIATKLVTVSGQVLMSDGAPASNGIVMLLPHFDFSNSAKAGLAVATAGSIFAILSAVFNAGTVIQTRRLTSSETTPSIVFYFFSISSKFSIPSLVLACQWISCLVSFQWQCQ